MQIVIIFSLNYFHIYQTKFSATESRKVRLHQVYDVAL